MVSRPNPRTLRVGANDTLAVHASATVTGLPHGAEMAALAVIATADATDLASAVALANACKAKINAVITALKA